MSPEEYDKVLDNELKTVFDFLRASTDPKAKEIAIKLDNICLNAKRDMTGAVLQTAVNVAHDVINKCYSKALLKGDLGITNLIESTLKNDPFYGDIVDNERSK